MSRRGRKIGGANESLASSGGEKQLPMQKAKSHFPSDPYGIAGPANAA